MVRLSTIVVVLVIVGMLFVAYWALFGFESTVDDFKDEDGDIQTGVTPTAFAIFRGDVSYAVMDYECDAVAVKTFVSTVYDFTSFDEGKVYQTDKFDLLAVEEVVGYLQFKVTVSKLDFTSSWTSEKVALTGYYGASNDDYSMETGRCFLPEKGTYTALLTVTFYGLDGGSSVEAQKTITFEVSM